MLSGRVPLYLIDRDSNRALLASQGGPREEPLQLISTRIKLQSIPIGGWTYLPDVASEEQLLVFNQSRQQSNHAPTLILCMLYPFGVVVDLVDRHFAHITNLQLRR